MRSVEVAAAPQIVRPIMDGVAKLCGFVTGNAALATLLVLRKWWPSTQIGQALQGGGTIGWCCAGITLGLCGILPSQILPFAAGLVAMLFQIVLNVISQVFGL